MKVKGIYTVVDTSTGKILGYYSNKQDAKVTRNNCDPGYIKYCKLKEEAPEGVVIPPYQFVVQVKKSENHPMYRKSVCRHKRKTPKV